MKTLIHAPLLKFALAFLAGLLCADFLPAWAIIPGIAPLIVLGISAFKKGVINRRRHERWLSLCVLLLAFELGGLRGWSQKQSPNDLTPLAHFNCETVQVMGQISSPIKVNRWGEKAQINLWAVAQDTQWVAVQGQAMFYAPPQSERHEWDQHDTILARVRIRDMRSRYPDYLAYLHQQGIFHALYADTLVVMGAAAGLQARAYRLQQALSMQVQQLLPDSTRAGVARAMFLGDKQGLSPALRKAFASAGLSHLLAISGLHVGIVFLLLNLVFAPLHLLRNGQRLKNILILFVLLGYMLITGASPAVVRAVLMFATILLFRISYQRYHMLNLIAIAALIQMIADPTVVKEIGFQLSYSAVLGIVCCMPYFEQMFPHAHPWIKKIYGWIGVSLIATLATLPLTLVYFGQFPTYFLLANLLVAGLAFPLVLSGFLMVLFAFVPGAGGLLALINGKLIDFLVLVAEGIAALPHALLTSWTGDQAGWGYLLLEMALAGLFLLLPRLITLLQTRKQISPTPIIS